MQPSYDVIVVGAGPAGSVAARLAAQKGLKVLLVEKRQEIGAPVRCAEAIGREVTRPYIEPDERWIDAHITAFDIHNSSGASFRAPPTEHTLVVNRKVFDLELASLASAAGAEIYTSACATGLIKEGSRVAGILLNFLGKETSIPSRLVIAADGTESQVARWAGLKTNPQLSDYYSCFQFLLSGVGKVIDPQVCEYHLGQTLAPGGYAWVFPKGPDRANVGLAVTPDRARDASAREYLERFIAARFPGSSILSVVSGGIPISGAIRPMVADGLMAVGDAAHQADPLTGGGINLGMMGADLAIRVACEALAEGDLSARRLKAYDDLWQQRFGRQHAALHSIHKIMTGMEDARLAALIQTASELPLESMTLSQILAALLKSHPRLLLEARALITTGLVLK